MPSLINLSRQNKVTSALANLHDTFSREIVVYKNAKKVIDGSFLLNDLIAYWKMEESSGTRYDSHGSYHLALYGDDPNAIESGGGVIGNSAIQNDLDENVGLYIAPSPYNAVNSSWSFSFWMSTNDNGDDTNQMFPNAWANCCLWRIRTLNGDTHQTVEGMIWYDELGAGTAFNANKTGIYEGGFVHVAVTHDLPTKTVRVYYNGVEEHVFVYNSKLSSVSPGNDYENKILSMFAGDRIEGFPNYPGPGKLDEVGIWGRVLEAGEISNLYNNGDGLTYENFNEMNFSPKYNSIYGNSGSSTNIDYVTVSATFMARVYYIKSDEEHFSDLNSSKGSQNKIIMPQGSVKIVVDPDGYNYIKEARKVEFDGITFAIRSDGNPMGLFANQYYEFYLTPINE